MAPSRLYYDPANPRMYTDDEITRFSPQEAQAACDQMDQNMVAVLQKIDENFSKANQILTERILPAVQKYGENSQQTWESVKFWKSFFEASANTRLSEPYIGDESFSTDENRQGHQAGLDGVEDQSLSFENAADPDGVSRPEGNVGGATPKALATDHQWSGDLSPFQALQNDLDKFAISAAHEGSAYPIPQATKDIQRVRLGTLPPDSPDTPLRMPDFETQSFNTEIKARAAANAVAAAKGKSRAFDLPPLSPAQPRMKIGADRHHPDLLQKILKKNLASPMPGRGVSSNPSATANLGKPRNPKGLGDESKTLFPDDIYKGWNGLADLGTTPLSAFKSRAKGANSARRVDAPVSATDRAPLSSLPLDFKVSPARYGVTPGREAARRVVQDVYEFTDSPIEPPSVMKEWHTRGYDSMFPQSPTASGRAISLMDENVGEDSFEENKGNLPPAFNLAGGTSTLADYGGGTTAKIDDLLANEDFARLEDDDEPRMFGVGPDGSVPGFPDEDEDEEVEPYHHESHGLDHEHSYALDEGISHDLPSGPEDTLFGMPQTESGGAKQAQSRQQVQYEDDSFESHLHEGSEFRVMGRNDMDTLHGGVLVESEPFEASPLAGRERREY